MQFLRTTLALAVAASTATAAPKVQFKPAFPNLTIKKPVTTAIIPGTDTELLVAQGGVIYVLPKDRNAASAEVWFDMTDRVVIDKDFEEGLLGLAFHPKFESNGKFYVYYSRQDPKRSILSEFVAKDGKPDPLSERTLLEIQQPYWNHDSGLPVFGPDGYLYVSTGDGGKANDPLLTSQNLFSLLGKILRIDVDSKSGELEYGIPKDNPFVGKPGVRAEIWAYGLRNPWGLHFDAKGRLWCADVGQAIYEEIDLIEKGGNYGWSYREGAHDFQLNRNPPLDDGDPKTPTPKLIDPVHEYTHADGISITGGLVYTGSAFPELKDHYIYGDWGSGFVWGLTVDDAGQKTSNVVLRQRNSPEAKKGKSFQPTHFTKRADGELWILSWDGKIYEMVKG